MYATAQTIIPYSSAEIWAAELRIIQATAAKIDQLVLDMVNKAYGDATKI